MIKKADTKKMEIEGPRKLEKRCLIVLQNYRDGLKKMVKKNVVRYKRKCW